MHALSHSEIRKMAGDSWTFQKGLDYYFAGRVRSIVMEKEGRFHARVQGTRLYHVVVTFRKNTLSTHCDCPAFARSSGICKHVVAVLLQLGKGSPTPTKEEVFDPRAERLLQELLALTTVPPAAREEIFLEPLLYLENHYHHPLALGLKAGPGRLYKVKDLRRFLLDLRAGRPITLTPKVTVRARLESLTEEDAALVERLLEIEAWSAAVARLSPYTAESLFFRKDRLLLGGKALEATLDALKDAGVTYDEIEHAYTGWVYADSCAGQMVLYEMGMTGIPIFNVNNNCATGSNALYLARQAVASGVVECALALGFEQMSPGALGVVFSDRPIPMFKFFEKLWSFVPVIPGAAPTAQLFGGAGLEYQQKYGTKDETFAKISVKARRNAKHNERAIFQDQVTVEEVLASP
ncbi:MAG: SWIM zinc finger family protein, partial [Firmicutes bacterium]|nr:SWIM zinc finger family protein [Bacillota bacterium]